MAYHRPLDAYEEYIARKHEREALTQEITLVFSKPKRPPFLCFDIGRDEADYGWWRYWLLRLPVALITSIGILGIPYIWPPSRSDKTRAELNHIDYRYMTGWPEGTGQRALAEIRATAPPLQSS